MSSVLIVLLSVYPGEGKLYPQKRHTKAAAFTGSAHFGQVFSAIAIVFPDPAITPRHSYVTDKVPSGLTISM
jgi:hypothetical protein